MATVTNYMSREQLPMTEFASYTSQLRTVITKSGLASLEQLHDVMTSATLQFANCELTLRHADRSAALDMYAARVAARTKLGASYNARGITRLGDAQQAIAELRKEGAPLRQEGPKVWKDLSEQMRTDWKEHALRLDVKPTDAAKIDQLMDDCLRAVDAGGVDGLVDHIGKNIGELQRLRASPDRGTQSNFPYWKLAAAAIWLGITVASVWRLVTFGAHWWDIAATILVAVLGTILIALGCY